MKEGKTGRGTWKYDSIVHLFVICFGRVGKNRRKSKDLWISVSHLQEISDRNCNNFNYILSLWYEVFGSEEIMCSHLSAV